MGIFNFFKNNNKRTFPTVKNPSIDRKDIIASRYEFRRLIRFSINDIGRYFSVKDASEEYNLALMETIREIYLGDTDWLIEGLHNVPKIKVQLIREYNIPQTIAQSVARDLVNKKRFALDKCRDLRLGITEGVWVHFAGPKYFRETHRAMNGKRFWLEEGLYDSDVGRYIMPTELITCCCTFRAVIPEFS